MTKSLWNSRKAQNARASSLAFCVVLFSSLALAACQMAKVPDTASLSSATVLGDGFYAISPTVLQVITAQKSNFVGLHVYTNAGASLSTNFNTGYINGITPNLSYSLLAYGVNSSNVETLNPLVKSSLRSWDTFAHGGTYAAVPEPIVDQTNGTIVDISWVYAPWLNLPAGNNALANMTMKCFVAPYSSGVNPITAAGAKEFDALVTEGKMQFSAGSASLSGQVTVGCEVEYADNTISAGANTSYINLDLSPAIQPCPATATQYASYACTMSTVASGVAAGTFNFALATGNTCGFVSVASGGQSLTGIPDDTNGLTCTLSFYLQNASDPTNVTRTITETINIADVAPTWDSGINTGAKTISEISLNDNDVATAVGVATSTARPRAAISQTQLNTIAATAISSNSAFVAHFTSDLIQTNKEDRAGLSGKNLGSYQMSTSNVTSPCGQYGSIFYVNSSNVQTSGINSATGEFFFEPEEHFYGTCEIDINYVDLAGTSTSTPYKAFITVNGYNDPPVISGMANTPCNGGNCYVGIDYAVKLTANTGGIDLDTSHASVNENAQLPLYVITGNCYATDSDTNSASTLVRLTYCQMDASNNIVISYTPIAYHAGVSTTISVVVTDSGNSANIDSKKYFAYPNTCLASSGCGTASSAASGSVSARQVASNADSAPYSFTINTAQYNLPLQPALIVSKAGCMSCHASVTGDFISDFGNTPLGATTAGGGRFRNDFFKTDTAFPDNPSWNGNPGTFWYGTRDMNSITGTFYTKHTTITNDIAPLFVANATINGSPVGPATDLVTFLTSTPWTLGAGAPTNDTYVRDIYATFVDACAGGVYDGYNGDPPKAPCRSTTSSPVPVSDHLPNTTHDEIDFMTISAPMPKDIIKIAQGSIGPAAAMTSDLTKTDVESLYLSPSDGSRPFSGLLISTTQPLATQTVNQGALATVPAYVTNSDDANTPILCYGDVAVKGNLFLHSPIFKTDSRGCRIHVTGDIIFYATNAGGTNANSGMTINSGTSSDEGVGIQITSASSINFGAAQDELNSIQRAMPASAISFATSLKVPYGNECYTTSRQTTAPSGGTCPSGYTPSGSSCVAAANTVVANTGSCSTGFGPYPAGGGVGYDAIAYPPGLQGWDHGLISYSGLMVNAPVITGRYYGNLTGSIIADYALMRLGDLVFTFDPVFTGQVPFPQLQNITSETGHPRVIFGAGKCPATSPSDAWQCNAGSVQ